MNTRDYEGDTAVSGLPEVAETAYMPGTSGPAWVQGQRLWHVGTGSQPEWWTTLCGAAVSIDCARTLPAGAVVCRKCRHRLNAQLDEARYLLARYGDAAESAGPR